MIRTHGLTHVCLAVTDAERSFRFYERIVGAVAIYRKPTFIQAQTPGCRDVIVFQQGEPNIGQQGGITHFGFRLVDPYDITCAIEEIEQAGGEIVRHGEFCPGEPFVFFKDPDGYEVELWFEFPTPVDP
jgi:catechol 2,3-dioxygenase-like lactoylglutathione lyase family enzyme